MRIVVPTERHVEILGSEDADVVSSGRFASRGPREPGWRPATRADRTLAIANALASMGRDPSPSVADAIDRSIGRLIDAGATLADLKRTGTSRGKITAEILKRTDALYAGKRVFDPRVLSVPLEEDDLEVRCTLDWEGGFCDLLARVHAARRALSERGVTIVIARPEGEEAALAPILEALEARFADAAHSPDIEYTDQPAPPWASATAVVCAGTSAEARRAAWEISRALDAGASLDRIGVVVPDGDEAFLEALRIELREAGVPWSEPWGRGPMREPEARAIASLLAMAETRVSREALLEILLTPGLHAGSWFREPTEVKARASATELSTELRAVPLLFDESGALFVESLKKTPALAEAMRRISNDIASLRKVASRADLATTLRALAGRLQLGEPSAPELWRSLGEKQAELRPLALAALGDGARAVRTLLARADEMSAAAASFGEPGAASGKELGASRIGELAAELLADVERSPIAPRGASARAGAIRIGPPREFVGLEHDLLVVARMTSLAYSGAGASDPWLDLATLSKLPRRAAPRSESELARVRTAEITLATAKARELVLLRSSLDADGREGEGPHATFSRALEHGARVLAEPASRVAPDASATSPRRHELVRLALGGPLSPDLVARTGIETERASFFADAERSAGPFTGRIAGATTASLEARLGLRGRPVSVTLLDAAAACAFRAFAERMLGARPTEDAEEAGAPRERGTLLHEALHLAFETWRALPPSLGDAEILAKIEAALARPEDDEPMSALRREVRRAVVEDALGVIRTELQEPRTLRYERGEQRFGWHEKDSLAPVELVLADGRRALVGGSIDRVDISPDRQRALVIDYKTGKAPPIAAIGVTAFQLPLYAAAVKHAFGVADVGVAYMSVRHAGSVDLSPKGELGRVLSDAELEEIASRAAALVSRVAAGNVAPRPHTPRECQRCNARDVCRRPVVVPPQENVPDLT